MKDRKPTSPKVDGRNGVNIDMDKPLIDLDGMVNRDSCDPRAQGRFLTLMKQACLNFKSTPIKYRQSMYHQADLMDINQ